MLIDFHFSLVQSNDYKTFTEIYFNAIPNDWPPRWCIIRKHARHGHGWAYAKLLSTSKRNSNSESRIPQCKRKLVEWSYSQEGKLCSWLLVQTYGQSSGLMHLPWDPLLLGGWQVCNVSGALPKRTSHACVPYVQSLTRYEQPHAVFF